MVAGLAFLATAIATLFAQATGVRCTRRAPAPRAGLDDRPRPVRARLGCARDRRLDRLGRRHLPGLLPPRRGAERAVAGARHRLPPGRSPRRSPGAQLVLSCSRGFAVGVLLSAPIHGHIAVDGHPGGQGPLRRAAARARRGRQRRRRDGRARRRGVVGGALRALARRGHGRGSRAATRSSPSARSCCRAAGSSRGSSARTRRSRSPSRSGIAVIYAGFAVASSVPRTASVRSARRSTLPAKLRGSSSTNSTRLGSL